MPKKRELEQRIADLERRVKELEARPVAAYPPYTPIQVEPLTRPNPWLRKVAVGDPPGWWEHGTITTSGVIGPIGVVVSQ